jgi:hypothetical protein
MARVNLAVDHGEDLEGVRAKFERTIATVQTRFGKWVRQVNWSKDHSSVQLTGTGFDVELTYDDKKVYVRGKVPIAFKLMERPVKAFIAQALGENP